MFICHVTSKEHMMWEVFLLYEWKVQRYSDTFLCVWYTTIKTQSLTEFRNPVFRRLLFLTLVLKNKDYCKYHLSL